MDKKQEVRILKGQKQQCGRYKCKISMKCRANLTGEQACKKLVAHDCEETAKTEAETSLGLPPPSSALHT